MKKIYTLIIALLITVGIANAQDSWVTHVADNRVSVKFPVEPKELTPGSFITTDKAGVAYVFTVVDFVQVAGIDSVALKPMKATREFAAQMKTGLLQSLPGVDMADFTIGTYKGFTSYTSTGTDAAKKRYNMFMFIIGNKLYSVSTVAPESSSKVAQENFVGSIVITN